MALKISNKPIYTARLYRYWANMTDIIHNFASEEEARLDAAKILKQAGKGDVVRIDYNLGWDTKMLYREKCLGKEEEKEDVS